MKMLRKQVKRGIKFIEHLGGLKFPNGPKPDDSPKNGEYFPAELDEFSRCIVKHIVDSNLSMTPRDSLVMTALSVKHCLANGIEGAFVECGVWRGGHGRIAAEIYRAEGRTAQLLLFDTFSGMTKPTELDVDSHTGEQALRRYELSQRGEASDWCFAGYSDVSEMFAAAGFGPEVVRLIVGDVKDTLRDANNLPEKISILRLDTDWYESTKIELDILYPRLVRNGVLIIDDYEAWAGSKAATDEYFRRLGKRPFLMPIAGGGRIGIKCD